MHTEMKGKLIVLFIDLRSLKGCSNFSPPPRFFGLKSEHLDQLPKALAQLFLDNEDMF